MWVLFGPFDGEIAGDTGFQKPKLLKPNTSYTVGRKDRALLLNNKKISHDHCDFVVGPHAVEDVSNPAVRPSLNIVNWSKKDKNILISRLGKELQAYPSSHEPLQDEDMVTLISGVHVTVKWIPICAYVSVRLFSAEDCASLGIKVVYAPHAEVTHHVISEYTADLSCSASLLSLCQFVKPEWLQEVIRLGKLPRSNEQPNGVSLEDHFILPQESKYRPAFSPSLLPLQRKLGVWEPNEERVNLFQTCRFICLHEKVTVIDTELREVIHRGGGILENFDIHSGIQKFGRALSRSRAKEGKKTVVVGNLDSMQLAVGKESWEGFLTQAQSSSIPVLPVAQVIQAVLGAKPDVLFEVGLDDTSEPSILPEPQKNEPSTRPTLVRRATSRAVSRDPSEGPSQVEGDSQQPAAPRRALTRRVMAKPTANSADILTSTLDSRLGSSSTRKTPPPELIDLTAPTPARPTKLKRRFGVTKESQAVPMSGIEETAHEPPSKKFKALFESTNAEGTESIQTMEEMTGDDEFGQTQTQGETQGQSNRLLKKMGLAALQEESEEETQFHTAGASQHVGRKRRMSSEEDVQMQVMEEPREPSTTVSVEPATKRRAVENVNSVAPVDASAQKTTARARGGSKPPSTFVPGRDKDKNTGAPASQPDTDEAFLKAIASTKRGKKNEDEFDREFNKLRISKPELARRDPEEEWGLLAEFGDDSGLRGNFMVIVEIDVPTKVGGSTALKERGVSREWDGKPNFKKFKKKVVGRHLKIDLFVSQENDYGMDNGHWKGGQSRPQSQMRYIENQSQDEVPESQPLWKIKKQTQPIADTTIENNLPPGTRRPRARMASRAGSATPAPSSQAVNLKVKKKGAKATPLFLTSDEDEVPVPSTGRHEESMLEDSSPEERRKPASGRKTRTAAAAKKPATRQKKQPILVEDDSDDDAVFRGFKGRG